MYWQKRNSRVYVYEHSNGKNKMLPRARTQHLDGQPDDVIDAFVRHLEGPKLARVQAAHPRLDSLLADYVAFLQSGQKALNPATIEMRRSVLARFVFPFFLAQDPPLTDPNTWPNCSVRLLEALQADGVSGNNIVQCNTALRGLWKWLEEEKLILGGIPLHLRAPPMRAQQTVLKFALKPDDVLAYARTATDEMAFIALVGYFFSLRTQETLALTRGDFCGKEKASSLECCRVMARRGLYSRFAVHVSKQNAKSSKDEAAEPKAHSKGWVACFNEEAAKRIVTLVKALADKRPVGPLLPFSPDYNMVRWRDEGIPNVTMKDLRRASIFWLGHHTDMDLIELRSHARHRRMLISASELRC